MKLRNAFPILGLVALLLGSSPVIALAASNPQKGQSAKPVVSKSQTSSKPVVSKTQHPKKPVVSKTQKKKSVTKPVGQPNKKAPAKSRN